MRITVLVRNRKTFSEAVSEAKRMSVSTDNREKGIKKNMGRACILMHAEYFV